MPRVERRRAGPWIGSVVLHVVFVAFLATAAIRWRTDAPPPQLAIEGSVVQYEDLPSSVKSGKPLREPAPQPEPVPPQPQPQPEPQPQPVPEPTPTPPDPAQQQAEARKLEQERIAVVAAPAELAGKQLWVSAGSRDQVLPLAQSHAIRDRLQSLPLSLAYTEFANAHEITADELAQAIKWLGRISA